MDPFLRSNTADKKREEAWFTLSTGEKFFPWRPDARKVFLVDIAHTLARINRWGGHAYFPYSVAQHCVNVAKFIPADSREKRGWALLHDATECYMGGDIISPIKRNVPDLVALETALEDMVERRFGFPTGALTDSEVKEADAVALAWEYRDLMPRVDGSIPEPMLSRQDRCPKRLLAPWSYTEAEKQFLDYAAKIGLKERLT